MISRRGLMNDIMIQRRGDYLVLRQCIGVSLLLSIIVAADTSKDPTVPSEQFFNVSVSETAVFENNKTALNEVHYENETKYSLADERGEATDSSNSITEALTTKDIKAVDKEKTRGTSRENSSGQRNKSHGQIDSPFGRGSKLENIVYEISEESVSTKTVSENNYELPQITTATTVAVQPFLYESSLDGEENNTTGAESLNANFKIETGSTAKPLKDTSKVKQYGDADAKSKRVTSQEKGNIDSDNSFEMISNRNEATTENYRSFGEFRSPAKSFEVLDMKRVNEKLEDDNSVSIGNGTYMNSKLYYKTSTKRNSEIEISNYSWPFQSSTTPMMHMPRIANPVDEVDAFINTTDSAIQRIIEHQSPNFNTEETGLTDETNKMSNSSKERGKDPVEDITEVTEIENRDHKLLQAAIEKRNRQETSPVLLINSSPIPRGRTVAFSEEVGFPDLEVKSTTKSDLSNSKKSVSEKPYPYVKSSIKDQLDNASNEVDVATERNFVVDTTIEKAQPEEKFVATEASDVLENSIQQFKPIYYDSVNKDESSTGSNAKNRPSATTMSGAFLQRKEDALTNQSFVDKLSDFNGIAKSDVKLTDTEKDAPQRAEEDKRIMANRSYDVSSNGVTEVGWKSDAKHLREMPRSTTPASMTTEFLQPRTDVQIKAEDSLLIFSTLNATELSTEYPLTERNTPDESSISDYSTLETTTTSLTDDATVIPTVIADAPVDNITDANAVGKINGNEEIPSEVRGTFGSDENFVVTTAAVEYEFVDTTESVTYISPNNTEVPANYTESSNLNTAAPIHASPMKNTSNEPTATTNEETVTNFPSDLLTERTEVANDYGNTLNTDPMIDPAVTYVIETTTKWNDIQSEGDPAMHSLNTTTEEEDLASTTIALHTLSTNPTEAPTEFTTIWNVNTTDTIRAVTLNPFTPSSAQPKILVSGKTSAPIASDTFTKATDDRRMDIPEQEEITSLIRIDIKDSWYNVCPNMEKLKFILAEILKAGTNKSVSDKQIIFHQNPCQDSTSSTPTSLDISLISILVYVVNESGKFDAAMTKILSSCYDDSREHITFPVAIHRFFLVQEAVQDSGNVIAVIVVSTVAFMCLILLAGLLFVMRKRQTRFNYGERCRPVSLDAYSLDNVSAYNSMRRKDVIRSSKRSYGNPTFEDSTAIPSHPLNFSGLSSFCNDVDAINEEFAGIPQISAKIDELPFGAEVKNRYANVIPLPETRVHLHKINNDPLTEYINASYVRGPKNATKYYIACQAPMELTVTDFWRMIWEQQCRIIIMLTDLFENGVEKCTEYIPPSEITDCQRLYGDYQVILKKRETKEKYAISTLHLKNLEKGSFREIYHIWYLWPVNGTPLDESGLIAVLLEARALQRGSPEPIVVHCSPGTGRTGTLIALDLGIRQYEITRTVDVPRVVYTIRRDRAGAVQTKEQYAFIYKALNLYATKLAGGVLGST